MSTITTYQGKHIRAIRDHVIVRDMNFSDRITTGGIIIPTDNGKTAGIRPRWARVYSVGPDQTEVKPNQYVLIAHGRWTRGITVEIDGETMVIRRVDNDDILAVSDEPQTDETFSEAIQAVSDRSRVEGSMHNHHTW